MLPFGQRTRQHRLWVPLGAAALCVSWAGGTSRALAADEPRVPAESPPFELVVRPVLQGTVALGIEASPAARKTLRRLLERLERREAVTPQDIDASESLIERNRREGSLLVLREVLLLEAAARAGSERRFPEAIDLFRRAANLHPTHLAAHIGLIDVFIKKADWIAAEGAAREALAVEPESPEAGVGLAYALLRQDRNDDAVRILEEILSRGAHDAARTLLTRLQRTVKQEKGLAEERVSRFTLRYDGEAHEAVGRRVLETLEEHYTTLAGQLARYPAGAIPVILLSKEQYYEGAPGWSAGEFDSFDGRIRVPIRGLTPGRVKELESTLLHELTHVFVADLTGGLAPRELQEGIAQFMEGKRVAKEVTRKTSGPAEVVGYYQAALSFVEYLVEQGSLATLSTALQAAGEAGDLGKGFVEVYGRSYESLQADWQNPDRAHP